MGASWWEQLALLLQGEAGWVQGHRLGSGPGRRSEGRVLEQAIHVVCVWVGWGWGPDLSSPPPLCPAPLGLPGATALPLPSLNAGASLIRTLSPACVCWTWVLAPMGGTANVGSHQPLQPWPTLPLPPKVHPEGIQDGEKQDTGPRELRYISQE